jgi:hypothetical protein
LKKNDKLIVTLGIVILVVASIGVYYWTPVEPVEEVEIKDFIDISGVFSTVPTTITVPMDSPFYALIASPVAVHYNAECEQQVIPLLVKNLSNPSRSLERVVDQLGVYDGRTIDNGESPKQVSLDIAMEYWEKSKAALLIENNQSGYELGVIATPLASYLSIPVIVTDRLDQEVIRVLNDLGVTHTMVCGSRIDGHGKVLRFDKVEEIVNASIELITTKFREKNPKFEIDYITLTNPIDAWPPKVLDRQEFFLEPKTIKSTSMTQLVQAGLGFATGSGIATWTFEVPEDYKYALVKFEGRNHDVEDVEELGDSASFDIGPNLPDLPPLLQQYELLYGGSTSASGIPERDESGQIVMDKVYSENVVYDRGGVEYTVKARGKWLVKKEGTVSGHVIVEKLEHPKYALMGKLSAIAPYLTAYHKGIILGRPEFAFTADDDVITNNGETCPGLYVPRRNPKLVPLSNNHIFDNIIDPLNGLLAKLADIELRDERDLKVLRDHYKNNPVYIALVGGATVLPNYIYQNHVEPVGDIDNDGVDDTPYYFGAGTPSDVIYGNIDHNRYDWDNKAGDMYSDTDFPYQENIVGRITGWDVQDASALTVRNMFYSAILKNYEEWRDNFGLLIGAGQDFQKPLLRYIIFGNLLGLVPHGEPLKLDTGYGEMIGLRTADQVVEPLGFNLQKAMFEAAMKKGLSNEALRRIKQDTTILNKLFFLIPQVKRLAGEGNVRGGEIMEGSNFLFVNAHGAQHIFGMAGNDLTAAGFGGPIIYTLLKQTLVPILGGFVGPGGDLSSVGDYTTRSVEYMEFGPSFMWLESCICGKIDGIDPRTSVGQSLLHAGVTSMIASPTGSNIAGGYLEPKRMKYDLPGIPKLKHIKAKLTEWNRGDYPEPHFGFKMYTDLCNDLREDNVTIGLAFRNAKNSYLPADADWELWWSPPLINTGDSWSQKQLLEHRIDLYETMASRGRGPMMESKYVSFQEYMLFGDPAFNPYEPINEG